MDAVPLSLALVAGGLATLNPCGFPLLPAFLSFYVGAEQETLPRAPNRLAQGMLVGLLVTAGFLGLFTVVGLPVAYGARVVARTVPWAGIAIGVALVTVGLFALAGRHVGIRLPRPAGVSRDRRASTMVLFGVGYGAASLGCTLPIFLTLVGASLGAGQTSATLMVFAAYGAGMGTVLMALAVAAALLQRGVCRALGRLLPYLPRLTGGLLVLSGGYLTYYWVRFRFGPRATVASDPVVGTVTRFVARVEVLATNSGLALMALPGLVVAASAAVAIWQWRRSRVTTRAEQGGQVAIGR